MRTKYFIKPMPTIKSNHLLFIEIPILFSDSKTWRNAGNELP